MSGSGPTGWNGTAPPWSRFSPGEDRNAPHFYRLFLVVLPSNAEAFLSLQVERAAVGRGEARAFLRQTNPFDLP